MNMRLFFWVGSASVLFGSIVPSALCQIEITNAPKILEAVDLSKFAQGDTNGDTELHNAVRADDSNRVIELIGAGSDVNAKNRQGRTPLHLAAEHIYRWESALTELLKAKPNVNAPDNDKMTPLHVLALSDSTHKREATQALIDAGADPNARDKHRRTAMQLLLAGPWPWSGADECISVLVAARADPRLKDDQGRNALHYLALLNQSPLFFIRNVTNTLTLRKLDLNAGDREGNTPLHLAGLSGSKDVFDWLLKRGARADTINSAGLTPFQAAARSTNLFSQIKFDFVQNAFYAIQQGKLETLHSMLNEQRYLANATNLAGVTLLQHAAVRGKTNEAALLLKYGAKWDATSAAALGNVFVLRRFLDQYPKYTNKAVRGESLLHLAAMSGSIPVAKLVLDAGGDLHAKDKLGLSPLGVALLKNRSEMADYLVKSGAVENIFDAIFLNRTDLATALISTNSSVLMETNGFGLAAAHVAVSFGRDDTVELMLKSGLPPDFTARNHRTLLHFAALDNRTNIAAQLLAHNAETEVFDAMGLTPLHIAAMYGSAGVVSILLQRGVNTETRTKPPLSSRLFSEMDGTALHLAVCFNRQNVIRVLLNSGAQINATNSLGLTSLDTSFRQSGVPPEGLFYEQMWRFSPLFADLTNSFPWQMDIQSMRQQQPVRKLLEENGALRNKKPR